MRIIDLYAKNTIVGTEMKKDGKPLISLIIPVYNVRKYIEECLDSVKAQTYRNLSVIIVDDGSTDGSGILCDEYSANDGRFTVFHTANRGLAAARNYGLDHIDIDAEYIAFLDSDDWLEPDAIQKLCDAAVRTGADLVACSTYNEYQNKTIATGSTEIEFVLENGKVLDSFIQEGYLRDAAWNKLYKVGLFSEIRYPEGRVYEDVATTYKLLMKVNKAVIIPYRLIHYRIRGGSIVRTHTIKYFSDHWTSFLEKYVALLEKTGDPTNSQRCLNGMCLLAISHAWRWYYDCPPADRKGLDPVMREMQDFVREHCNGVIMDRRYTLHQRAACIWTKTRNPLMLRVLYYATLLYKVMKNERAYEK